MYNTSLQKFLQKQKVNAVQIVSDGTIEYSKNIKGPKIEKVRGDEENVRAYLVSRLVNQLGYKIDNIELEKEYKLGRPKTIYPRIDIILRDENGDAFLFIEVKSPSEFENNKDEYIEKQLFNMAAQEAKDHDVKYLVYYTYEEINGEFKDKCIIIDYAKFKSFDVWKNVRDYTDTLPSYYEKPLKIPYIKKGNKDLEKNYTHKQIDAIRKNLHNVLWGGGGTDDNDVFSSLVNLILAKIQDESERNDGEEYHFQIFANDDGESIETNEELFERINVLYRKALDERLNITDKSKLLKSYVIDENKFSLSKLKYTVSELERFSFVDGKNSLTGKDILGDFFEGIVRNGFKQSKGQFFTHINIIKFIMWGLQLDKLAIDRINKDKVIPYLIDPAAGSGTFLIEYMKFITQNVKYRLKDKLNNNRDIDDKFHQWFMPDHRENKWAQEFIYGVEINFNLGTASKVNMILHGDGSTNIFVKDGLLPFNFYEKETAPNFLNQSHDDPCYHDKKVNSQFDIVISNPPFSVDLDNETKMKLKEEFLFGDKKNSENFFIERWYQLLKPNGRFGVVLPESVFDTIENKYIRLFVYKYFKVKAIVSLPQLAFEPYTSTKTSLLFAQKKTFSEIEEWNKIWKKYSDEWSNLKTRCENLIEVYIKKQSRTKFSTISSLTNKDELKILFKMLKGYLEEIDKTLNPEDLVKKYYVLLKELCQYDKGIEKIFGYVNTSWVFSQTSKELNYDVFMAEVENIGYKRTKRGEKLMPNELFRTDELNNILIDDNIFKTALDHIRKIKWD